MTNRPQMRAIVITEGGGPEVLQIQSIDKPVPEPGWILIRVRAFGINRCEIDLRRILPQGSFPRILGVEAVGEVEEAPTGELAKGSVVATVMGFLQSQFWGSYAEYICVPLEQTVVLQTALDWRTLGALPQMFHVAWCSLVEALQVRSSDRLLIRGGSTSVGLAATAIARNQGLFVVATTRDYRHKQPFGAGEAFYWLDDPGRIAELVVEKLPLKFDKVLDLIGARTMVDSMHCVKEQGGVVCMAGTVGGATLVNLFSPIGHIPNGVHLTSFRGDANSFRRVPLQSLVDAVAMGKIPVHIARSFAFEEIADAHRFVEENHGAGKVVITL